MVSDGDGSQDHLLPVCMDDACTKSAIYLAKPGGTEVQNTRSVHHVQSFFIFPVLFFFLISVSPAVVPFRPNDHLLI